MQVFRSVGFIFVYAFLLVTALLLVSSAKSQDPGNENRTPLRGTTKVRPSGDIPLIRHDFFWNTEICYVNDSDRPRIYRTEFFEMSGAPAMLPIRNEENRYQMVTTLQGELRPFQTRCLRFEWAQPSIPGQEHPGFYFARNTRAMESVTGYVRYLYRKPTYRITRLGPGSIGDMKITPSVVFQEPKDRWMVPFENVVSGRPQIDEPVHTRVFLTNLSSNRVSIDLIFHSDNGQDFSLRISLFPWQMREIEPEVPVGFSGMLDIRELAGRHVLGVTTFQLDADAVVTLVPAF